MVRPLDILFTIMAMAMSTIRSHDTTRTAVQVLQHLKRIGVCQEAPGKLVFLSALLECLRLACFVAYGVRQEGQINEMLQQ